MEGPLKLEIIKKSKQIKIDIHLPFFFFFTHSHIHHAKNILELLIQICITGIIKSSSLKLTNECCFHCIRNQWVPLLIASGINEFLYLIVFNHRLYIIVFITSTVARSIFSINVSNSLRHCVVSFIHNRYFSIFPSIIQRFPPRFNMR